MTVGLRARAAATKAAPSLAAYEALVEDLLAALDGLDGDEEYVMPPPFEGPIVVSTLHVPVVNGRATLPDGRIIETASQVVAVPVAHYADGTTSMDHRDPR